MHSVHFKISCFFKESIIATLNNRIGVVTASTINRKHDMKIKAVKRKKINFVYGWTIYIDTMKVIRFKILILYI